MLKNKKKFLIITLIFLITHLFLLIDSYKKKEEQISQNTQEISQNQNKKKLYDVLSVADGDTLTVRGEGGEKNVLRLLGIDAPELPHPPKTGECFSEESREYLKSLVLHKKVFFLHDPLKPEKDVYKRELVYVFTEDGFFINQALIEEGFAYEYFYKKEPYHYHALFKKQEEKAKREGKGLWGDKTCKGLKKVL